jgi:glycosyltransferase involved in cell wall biosynthesis
MLVTPSEWLRDTFLRAKAGHPNLRVIPNGIDLATFRPKSREAARRQLGLPAGRLVILFVARRVAARGKGFEHALKVASQLADIHPILAVVGDSVPGNPTAEIRHFQSVNDDDKMAVLYSAADLLLQSSIADNFPLTSIEALACGLPIFGFASGGLPEIVTSGIAGRLVTTGDWIELSAAIRSAFLAGELPRLASSCSMQASRFSHHSMVAQYEALFQHEIDALHAKSI